MFSGRPFVRLLPNHEHDILKKNEPIMMAIGRNGPRGKDMKRSTLRVSGVVDLEA